MRLRTRGIRRARIALGSLTLGSLLAGAGVAPGEDTGAVLEGRALLPATAYQEGPPSGAQAGAGNGLAPPYPSQILPGFSALIDAGDGEFWGLPDNGFGSKRNSADFLLRLYRIRPDLRTGAGGSGTLEVKSFVQLHDPDARIPFPLTRPDRLLTGADFDPESVRQVADGTFWFGDEYGPFLLHTDATGKVLDPPVPLPGVVSPDNPAISDPGRATTQRSRGFEAMGMDRSGRILYPMVEGRINGDDPHRRVLRQFTTFNNRYTGLRWFYRVDEEFPGAVIGDMAAVGDLRFVVIERDTGQGAEARHKRVYLIDLRRSNPDGSLRKLLVVDLLRIADPAGISSPARPGEFGVGPSFSYPMDSVESITALPDNRLLIANDNNFPHSDGRWVNRDRPDDIELIVVHAPALARRSF